MLAHQSSTSFVLFSVILTCIYSTTAISREKREILKPDVYRCKNRSGESILTKNRGKYADDVYELGQVLEVECRVPSEDLTHEISILLDDEPLELKQSNEANIRNGSRILGVNDNGKKLRCVVSNRNEKFEVPETSRKIEVYFPPQPQAQDDVDRCGYGIGDNAVINVHVYANPEPTFKWSANPEKYVKNSTRDKSNRFRILSTEDLGMGHWLVKLSIDELKQLDFERFYYLQASNRLGSNSYIVFIKIHCDEEQRSNFLANGI